MKDMYNTKILGVRGFMHPCCASTCIKFPYYHSLPIIFQWSPVLSNHGFGTNPAPQNWSQLYKLQNKPLNTMVGWGVFCTEQNKEMLLIFYQYLALQGHVAPWWGHVTSPKKFFLWSTIKLCAFWHLNKYHMSLHYGENIILNFNI